METRIDILDELNALSPMLAGMEKVNVFTVPAGYFEGLEASVLSALKQDDPVVSILPKKPAKADVPEGYFEGLADSILAKIKMQEVVAEESLSPLMQSLRAVNVFTVPAGYFDGLSNSIDQRMLKISAAEELKQFSPALQYLQQENVFEVPKGYFDNLSDELLSKVQPQHAKVVTMRKRSSFFKYAVAAMLTGAVAFGGYKYFGGGSAAKLTSTQQFGLSIAGDSTKQEAEFAKLSDDDIVKFLVSSGENVDLASVNNVNVAVDANELPSKEDYLLDDQALDNFLNDLKADDKDLKN